MLELRDTANAQRLSTRNGPPPKERRENQCAKILTLLRAAGKAGVTNYLLNQTCCLRYTGRIRELREAGCVIETKREGQSIFRFILTYEPEHLRPLRSYEPRNPAPEQPSLFSEMRQ